MGSTIESPCMQKFTKPCSLRTFVYMWSLLHAACFAYAERSQSRA